MTKYLLVLPIVLFFSCAQTVSKSDIDLESTESVIVSNALDKEEAIVESEVVELSEELIVAQELQKILKNKNIEALQDYIDPNMGVYIISDSEGAMPRFHKIFKLSEFNWVDGSGFSIYPDHRSFSQECEIIDTLPAVTCEEGEGYPYKISGCFISNEVEILDAWNYIGWTERQIQPAEIYAGKMTHTFLITGNYKYFLFKNPESKWVIGFIDAMTPCEG